MGTLEFEPPERESCLGHGQHRGCPSSQGQELVLSFPSAWGSVRDGETRSHLPGTYSECCLKAPPNSP